MQAACGGTFSPCALLSAEMAAVANRIASAWTIFFAFIAALFVRRADASSSVAQTGKSLDARCVAARRRPFSEYKAAALFSAT
jgi:hypothetical protein